MKTTKKMIQQNFEKKISGFKCAADLQYFLMNLLNLINYMVIIVVNVKNLKAHPQSGIV